MFKRLRKALQLKPRTFQPASSAAMTEARETKDIREKQKTQQQSENSSEGAASSGHVPEKHVSFNESVLVRVRTPSPISPISPSCNLESGFIFPKTTDEQSQPTSSSSILTRYYAAAENTATSQENQRNPQAAIFYGKTLERRMEMLYKSSLVSQGIFTKPDSTDDQEENSDQCSCEELSVDVAGACGGYDHDG
ncbi:hypothetical protein [Orientia tsutsugamushi]|uniref:hypothetical protein n=1 Tax=Orientia tsutsugamushi TaxID=784 RepID=UPI000D5A39F3|nr:Uncharacterised protein [Orientia tsutsugamushi]